MVYLAIIWKIESNGSWKISQELGYNSNLPRSFGIHYWTSWNWVLTLLKIVYNDEIIAKNNYELELLGSNINLMNEYWILDI